MVDRMQSSNIDIDSYSSGDGSEIDIRGLNEPSNQTYKYQNRISNMPIECHSP